MKPSRALIVAFLLTVAVIAISAQDGAPPRVPGIDTGGMDRSVRPQDDFFRFVNGTWADKTPIPADRPSYGTIATLRNQLLTDTHSPGMLRAFVPLTNIDAFYAAFNLQPGDKLYRAPADRVKIW